MSTKSTRKTTSQQSTTTQASSSATPQTSTRPQSPGLSPTRFSRLQEKADLQNLNDRLACYIDRVRQLETENSGLRREVQTSQETITREVTTLKHMYEKELSDARRLLDDTSRERARLEIDTKRMYEENAEMKTRLDKKTKDLSNAEKHLTILEPKVADLTAKYNQAVIERKKAQDEAKELEKDCAKLRAQVNELRKFLEEETLIRIDLENNLQSLREDLNFKEQVFNKELTETRTRRQVEISEIDGRLSEVYEAKLQQTLQDLRDQYEAQMRSNREEIETLYDAKIRNAQNQAQRNSGAASSAMEEIRQSRVMIDTCNSKITELENANKSLSTRVRDMEKMLISERESSMRARQALERELQLLQDEMEKQLQEYQDLMDIKVALDLEIAAYRKLLESEEARLNISPMQSPAARTGPGGRSTPVRRTPVNIPGRKRKRMEESTERSMSQFEVTSHASGDVEIAEVCPEGRFVRLRNKGDKEVSLSGWQILRVAGDNESSFKFHRSAKLEAGGVVNIWSSDAGQTAEPPSNLVMKGQKWFVSDSMTTFIKDAAGEEMASSERKRQQHSISRHREMSGFLSSQRGGLGEDLYHQQGDPNGDDRCAIM